MVPAASSDTLPEVELALRDCALALMPPLTVIEPASLTTTILPPLAPKMFELVVLMLPVETAPGETMVTLPAARVVFSVLMLPVRIVPPEATETLPALPLLAKVLRLPAKIEPAASSVMLPEGSLPD